MNPATRQRLRTTALALALAAPVALTLYTAQATPALLRQLQRRQTDLQHLQDLAGRHAGDQAAVRAFEATGQSAAPLAELLQAAAPAVRADVHEREVRPLLAGWSVHLMDVMLDDVYLADAGQLLNRAEAARPPWRATECQITATDGTPGRGRVSLTLEGLTRSSRGAAAL